MLLVVIVVNNTDCLDIGKKIGGVYWCAPLMSACRWLRQENHEFLCCYMTRPASQKPPEAVFDYECLFL